MQLQEESIIDRYDDYRFRNERYLFLKILLTFATDEEVMVNFLQNVEFKHWLIEAKAERINLLLTKFLHSITYELYNPHHPSKEPLTYRLANITRLSTALFILSDTDYRPLLLSGLQEEQQTLNNCISALERIIRNDVEDFHKNDENAIQAAKELLKTLQPLQILSNTHTMR